MILVTGATGTVGTEVVRQLIAAGHRPRLFVRDPARVSGLADRAEIATGDLDDAASVASALAGIDALFLLSAGLEGPRQERQIIDLVGRAGVKHVVKLSVMGAEQETITFGRWHRDNEKRLEDSSMAWTFLRPGSFASNALGWADTIRRDGVVYLPVGDGASAVIDPADIGAVAVVALTTPGHHDKAYTLSGPEAISVGQQARIIGEVIGRPVTHIDLPPAAARQAMLDLGLPEAYVDGLSELHAATRAGHTAAVTRTVDELLGRSAGSFERYVRRHANAWR